MNPLSEFSWWGGDPFPGDCHNYTKKVNNPRHSYANVTEIYVMSVPLGGVLNCGDIFHGVVDRKLTQSIDMDFSWIGASAAYGVQHQLLLSAIVSNLKMEMEPQWQVSHKRITPVKLCQIWLARIFLRIWRGFSAEARRVDINSNLLGRLGSVNITKHRLSL